VSVIQDLFKRKPGDLLGHLGNTESRQYWNWI